MRWHRSPWGVGRKGFGLTAIAVLGFAATGCIDLGAFACAGSSQCQRSGEAGICTDAGYCAFPDDACEGGYRYHARSPAGLAGACVPASVPGSSDTGLDPSTTTTTTSPDPTTTMSVPASSSDSGVGTTGGFSCGDRPCPCAIDIAAGESHTCAVRDDGSVACWGNNDTGELGTGEMGQPVPWPQDVLLPPDFVANRVITGNHHTCATSGDGQAYCWGRNRYGEVLPTAPDVDQPEPQPVTWLPSIGPIALSPRHTCAATSRGDQLTCWGENAAGQLGTDLVEPGPHAVEDPNGIVDVIDQIGLGRQHTCVRSGNEVSCWGSDVVGQLGDGEPLESRSTPTLVPLGGNAVRMVSGRLHVCATIGDGSELRCWGDAMAGQLGPGLDTLSADPVTVAPSLPSPARQLSGRLDGTCALTQERELWCWGFNGADKYGVGSEDPVLQPTQVPIVSELSEPIEAVALGDHHICVITEGGYVWCWGADDVEQLGPFDPMPGERAVELDLLCPRR